MVPVVLGALDEMKSGSVTNGVETGAPQSIVDGGGRIGSDLPSAGRYGCSVPEPPARFAGFVHAASRPAPPDRRRARAGSTAAAPSSGTSRT
jgi:hypothetical protein